MGPEQLARHGYGLGDLRRLTVSARHGALRAAARQHGWPAVHRALNNIYTRGAGSDGTLATILAEDIMYARTLS